MKALLIMILAAVSAPALAFGPDQEPGGSVRYESWCEGDVVKGEDRNGDVVFIADCYNSSTGDEQKACVETARKVGEKTIISATCQ